LRRFPLPRLCLHRRLPGRRSALRLPAAPRGSYGGVTENAYCAFPPSQGMRSNGGFKVAKGKQAQALATKLSYERRAGKPVAAPPKGHYSESTRKRALRDLEIGRPSKIRGSRNGRSE